MSSPTLPIIGNAGSFWKGQPLGLYSDPVSGGESDVPPSAYQEAAIAAATALAAVPTDWLMVVQGLSNTNLEWGQTPNDFVTAFKAAKAAGTVNTKLTLLNCAFGSHPLYSTSGGWYNNAAGYWTQALTKITAAGFTANDVRVVCHKLADANVPIGNTVTAADLSTCPHVPPQKGDADFWFVVYYGAQWLRFVQTQYPNCLLAFIHARMYGGYAPSTASSPEPFAFEQGLAWRYLLNAQAKQLALGTIDTVAGDLVTNCPILAWGPYMWANGLTPNSLGVSWNSATDYAETTGSNAYIHPSQAGILQWTQQSMAWYSTNQFSAPWFT